MFYFYSVLVIILSIANNSINLQNSIFEVSSSFLPVIKCLKYLQKCYLQQSNLKSLCLTAIMQLHGCGNYSRHCVFCVIKTETCHIRLNWIQELVCYLSVNPQSLSSSFQTFSNYSKTVDIIGFWEHFSGETGNTVTIFYQHWIIWQFDLSSESLMCCTEWTCRQDPTANQSILFKCGEVAFLIHAIKLLN